MEMVQHTTDLFTPSFETSVKDLKIGYFLSFNEESYLKCFHTTSNRYEEGREYSLYELPAVMRVLATKISMITKEVSSELVIDSDSQVICHVLEWSSFVKKVILFDFSKVKEFNTKEFKQLFRDKKSIEMAYMNRFHKRGFNDQ